MFQKILGNVWKDFRECSRNSQGMFQKITESVPKDSENVKKDSLESKVMFSLENLSQFYQILQLNWKKTIN